MLGDFAVGKTSLVQRFVKSIFSEKYQTTIGVKIDQKSVAVNGQDISLIIWDIHGEDEFQKIRASYLRGAAGYLLVADGTRRVTLDNARLLRKTAEETLGRVPFVLVLNKTDLTEDWEIADKAVTELAGQGWTVIRGSAKTGQGVEEAFSSLGRKLVTL